MIWISSLLALPSLLTSKRVEAGRADVQLLRKQDACDRHIFSSQGTQGVNAHQLRHEGKRYFAIFLRMYLTLHFRL
jgi:hypothetical protein